MEHIKEHLAKLREVIDKKSPPQVNKILDDYIEKKTQGKVKKEWVVAGLGVFLFLLFIFGDLAGLVCNLVGFVYPAYMSFKAIETDTKDDDTQWLTYWVVYSFFSVLETFVSFLLSWIPFYFAIKLAFLFYLFSPKTRGAQNIYENFLKRALDSVEKNGSEVDKVKKAVDKEH